MCLVSWSKQFVVAFTSKGIGPWDRANRIWGWSGAEVPQISWEMLLRTALMAKAIVKKARNHLTLTWRISRESWKAEPRQLPDCHLLRLNFYRQLLMRPEAVRIDCGAVMTIYSPWIQVCKIVAVVYLIQVANVRSGFSYDCCFCFWSAVEKFE